MHRSFSSFRIELPRDAILISTRPRFQKEPDPSHVSALTIRPFPTEFSLS